MAQKLKNLPNKCTQSAARPFFGDCFIVGTCTLLSVVTDGNNATRDSRSYGQQLLADDTVTRRGASAGFRDAQSRDEFSRHLRRISRRTIRVIIRVGFITEEEDVFARVFHGNDAHAGHTR